MTKEEILSIKRDGTFYFALNPDLKASIHEDVADGITIDLAFGKEIAGIEILGSNEWPASTRDAFTRYFEEKKNERDEILRYNKKEGTLYLVLNQRLKPSVHEDVADGVTIDLTKNSEVVGIEILGVNEWPDKIKHALIKYFEGNTVNDD